MLDIAMNTVAQPVTAVISTVLGLGGSSGINNVLRTVVGFTTAPFVLHISCSSSGSGLRWSIERWLWSRAADRVVVNPERRCVDFSDDESLTLLAAHLSNLALCERPGHPCAAAPDSAYLLLLSGATTIFFHSGVEAWVQQYAFGRPAPPSKWWRSGSFYQFGPMRATLRIWHGSINASGAAGASQAARALPQQLLQHDVSVLPRTNSFLSKLPERFAGLPMNMTSGLGMLRTQLPDDAAYDGRVACDCRVGAARASRTSPGWWLNANLTNAVPADTRGGHASYLLRRTAAFPPSALRNCTDAQSASCGAFQPSLSDCMSRTRLTRRFLCKNPGIPNSSLAMISIACVGDSLTAGVGASSYEKSYPSRMRQRLQLPVGSAVNLGVAGARVQRPAAKQRHSSKQTAFADKLPSYWDTAEFSKALLEHATGWDVIVSLFGTNDVVGGTVVVDGCTKRPPQEASNATAVAYGLVRSCPFVRDYVALIERMKTATRAGTSPIITLVIPPPVPYDNCGVDQAAVSAHLPVLVRSVALVAGLAPPIDAWAALGGVAHQQFPLSCTRLAREPPPHCGYFACDRVHLNDGGYEVLSRLVAESVAMSLGRKKSLVE